MTEEEEAATRSVQATLISCLVTLAVSFTSWLGDPAFLDPYVFLGLNLGPSVQAVITTLVFPFAPLLLRLDNAMRVASVLRILQQHSIDGDDHRNSTTNLANCINFFTRICNFKLRRQYFRRASRVGIMSVCPIIIPIPPALEDTEQVDVDSMVKKKKKKKIELMVEQNWCEIKDSKFVEGLCPVVMKAGASSSSSADDDEMKGYYDYNNVMTTTMGFKTAAAPDHAKYLYFDPINISRCSLMLLKVGLVPPYSQLCFLRTRSRFQALVTFMQTLGFTIGLVQRLGQGLGVSPMEVWVSYFAIMALVHVGLDLFACASFQTTLLLPLSPHDFKRFLDKVDDPDTIHFQPHSPITLLVAFAAYLFITAAAGIYYSIHYWHAASSWVTRLVFPLFIFQQGGILLALVIFSRFFGETMPKAASSCITSFTFNDILFSFFLLLSVAVAVVAIVGTVMDWDLFMEAAKNEIAWIVAKWILPHISSN